MSLTPLSLALEHFLVVASFEHLFLPRAFALLLLNALLYHENGSLHSTRRPANCDNAVSSARCKHTFLGNLECGRRQLLYFNNCPTTGTDDCSDDVLSNLQLFSCVRLVVIRTSRGRRCLKGTHGGTSPKTK